MHSRRKSLGVKVGAVTIGGSAPIIVQSMTNTDTADIEGTVAQVKALARAGSELVRVTVNNDEAAAAVPHIRERLDQQGIRTPLVGDFHFNGHKLLKAHPDCAQALGKLRINPGNVGRGSKRDPQFAEMIETACRYSKPVRIGVNWGSLDQDLLTRMMDENSKQASPLPAIDVMREAIVVSAFDSAKRAQELGLGADKIVISAKVSGVQDLIAVYRNLAARCTYPLHLGLTEAGMGSKGIVASTAAMGVLLAGGHRRYDPRVTHAGARRRPHAGGDRRSGDSADHGTALLHADGHCLPGLRPHHQHLLPGARTENTGPHPPPHAGVAQTARRGRGHDGRGHGLRGQRTR